MFHVDSVFEQVRDHFGALDLLVNNASTFVLVGWRDLGLDVLEAEWGANVKAPFLCAKAAEPVVSDKSAYEITPQCSMIPPG
jgi:NAD(P)-dependent dehydrogenase (short-subunit alcohol dehydrogenase family)